MRTSKFIGEVLIVCAAFNLVFTDGRLGFGIVDFWDYASLVGLAVGLFLVFKGGLREQAEDLG